MISDRVGDKKPTTKPDDMVRTPSGATGFVEAILPDHVREVRLLNGELLTLRDELLFVVRAALPRRWRNRAP